MLFCTVVYSCVKDSDLQPNQKGISPRSENIYLFDEILLSGTEGNYAFLSTPQTVQSLLEDILIDDNAMLTSVDEFGIDTTELGNQYVYVVQYGTESAVTLFSFLTEESGAVSIGGQSVGGANTIKCVNAKCCEKCVISEQVNSVECVCHSTQWECIRTGQTDIRCNKYESQTI